MVDDELELLITVVVGAEDTHHARSACAALLERVGGRIVECADCSDEEPGCWSVMIRRPVGSSGTSPGALSRAVRDALRQLDVGFARVSCEPPTAWAVADDPERISSLVRGGERVLVEAWAGGPATAALAPEHQPAAEVLAEESGPATGNSDSTTADGDIGTDGEGRPRPRLGLLVDVVTERRAGAEWPARALASRLCRRATIISSTERPPVVRIALDLGPDRGDPTEIVDSAAARLGGAGWTRPRVQDQTAAMRWTAAPTPPSGIAAVELTASTPERNPADSAPSTQPPEHEATPAGAGNSDDRGAHP